MKLNMLKIIKKNKTHNFRTSCISAIVNCREENNMNNVKIERIRTHWVGIAPILIGEQIGWSIYPITYKNRPYVVDLKLDMRNLKSVEDMHTLCCIYEYGEDKKIFRKHKRKMVWIKDITIVRINDKTINLSKSTEDELLMIIPELMKIIFEKYEIDKIHENSIKSNMNWDGIVKLDLMNINKDKESEIKELKEEVQKLSSINNSLYVLIDSHLGYNPIIRNEKVYKILRENDLVNIRFHFDWNNYKSVIKIIGSNTNEEYEQRTPQIPLIGGAWSNLVATRCLTGQIFVSALLECVRLQLEFIVKDRMLDTKIKKNDNCFYAPFMTYMVNENGEFSNLDDNRHIEYHDLLKRNYPEAYKQVINLKDGENYWDKYHDVY